MDLLTTDEFKKMRASLGSGLTVVNTLPMHLFFSTHIPGSVNIPAPDVGFVEQVEELAGGKTEAVVVYSASRECTLSEKAARELTDAGFQHVYRYVGGAKEWQESGEVIATMV